MPEIAGETSSGSGKKPSRRLKQNV